MFRQWTKPAHVLRKVEKFLILSVKEEEIRDSIRSLYKVISAGINIKFNHHEKVNYILSAFV